MDNSQETLGEIWRPPDDTLMGPLAAFRVYYWDMQKYESRWEMRVKGGDTEGEIKEREWREDILISEIVGFCDIEKLYKGKEVYCENRNLFMFLSKLRKEFIDIFVSLSLYYRKITVLVSDQFHWPLKLIREAKGGNKRKLNGEEGSTRRQRLLV